MPSREERNRKKYDEGVHKGHRYTNVDDLKSDYYVINRCWNEDQEKLKNKKSKTKPPPLFFIKIIME